VTGIHRKLEVLWKEIERDTLVCWSVSVSEMRKWALIESILIPKIRCRRFGSRKHKLKGKIKGLRKL
jgi:hypothetical protein